MFLKIYIYLSSKIIANQKKKHFQIQANVSSHFVIGCKSTDFLFSIALHSQNSTFIDFFTSENSNGFVSFVRILYFLLSFLLLLVVLSNVADAVLRNASLKLNIKLLELIISTYFL